VGYAQMPLSEMADESDMDVPRPYAQKRRTIKTEAEADNIPWRELALKIMTVFIWVF
jgi:hypothetical protein